MTDFSCSRRFVTLRLVCAVSACLSSASAFADNKPSVPAPVENAVAVPVSGDVNMTPVAPPSVAPAAVPVEAPVIQSIIPSIVPPFVPPLASTPPTLSQEEGRALVVKYLPTKVADREGWAGDIYTAFSVQQIAPTPENICSAVAIIEQESSFQADPVVPGLGKIVWGQIELKAHKYGIPLFLVQTALLKK